MDLYIGRGIKRIDEYVTVNLQAGIMRSDGFEGIHGSTSCQSHEEKEKFYHGDGLALEDCVGSHYLVCCFFLFIKSDGSAGHFQVKVGFVRRL